jgi:cytochrome c oxidase cbb3-type subunit 2
VSGSLACAALGVGGSTAGEAPAGGLFWSTVEVPPSGASDDVAAGRMLFLGRCTSCHGVDGRGDGPAARFMGAPPRDFADGLYKLRSRTGFPSDEDLYRTISAGIRRGGMPSMEFLSPDERWQLVSEVLRLGRAGFVRDQLDDFAEEQDLPALPPFEAQGAEVFLDGTVADEWPAEFLATVGDEELFELELDLADELADLLDPGDAVDLGPPPAVTGAQLERGRELYTRWGCARCHGEQGRADGPLSPTLTNARGGPIPALDLTSDPHEYKGGGSVGDVARILATGMSGTPMPSYRLGPESDEDIWALAHWVVSLQQGQR